MAWEWDESKDVVIWREMLGSGLEVSVRSYSGGRPKLSIGPRWFERGGAMVAGKAGRLALEEFEDLAAFRDDIVRAMGWVP